MSEPAAPLRTSSLRRRVTVAVWLLLAAMVAVLAIATSIALSARLDGQLRQRLTDRADVAAALVGKVSADQLVDRLESDGVSVILVTSSGRTISKGPLAQSGSGNATPVPVPPPGQAPAGPAGGPAAPVVQQGDLYRVDTSLSDGSRLTLIASAADVRRTIAQVVVTLIVGGLAVLAVAAAVLGPLVGRALRPLAQMTETARSITAGDRGRRLRPTRPETELGRTAEAFDSMLDAVEGAEQQARAAEDRLRRFLSDAAHELRTPLTGARAATEQVLRADLDRAEREQRLVTAIRENDRAARLVDDLLTMARIDQGLELRPQLVDLTELVRRAVRARALTAPDARLAVHGPPVLVRADPDRIVQIVSNLLDNALRAGGPRTRVWCETRTVDHRDELTVRDDGPGVPAADRARIFDRLVRLDESRSRQDRSAGEGFGLGLPIARGIARAHGGDLVCLPPEPGRSSGQGSDRPPVRGGATFRLTLPSPAG